MTDIATLRAEIERRCRDAVTGEPLVDHAWIDITAGQLRALLSALQMAESERDNWIETARQTQRNCDFYRGIVTQIGETFGEAAKTSDDGSVQQDVLALKVPELVAAAESNLAEAMTVIEEVAPHRLAGFVEPKPYGPTSAPLEPSPKR